MLPLFRGSGIIPSFVLILLFAVAQFAQADTEKSSIVVIPFTESGRAVYGGAEISNLLYKELAANGKFTVIDKSKPAAIEAEIKKGPKDTIDIPTAAEIAHKAGAQFTVLGTVLDYTEKVKTSFVGAKTYEANVKFSVRVVNAATAEVVLSQSFEKSGVSVGEIKNVNGSFGSKAMQDCINKSIKDAVNAIGKHLASAGTK